MPAVVKNKFHLFMFLKQHMVGVFEIISDMNIDM